MKNKKRAEKIFTDYYETARKSLITKMKSEEEEITNLKIKIASFVIYELSHSNPSWFKTHFLANLSQNNNEMDIIVNTRVLKVESAFYNAIADCLISMESEDDYVKKTLTPFTEGQKKDFWKPIVFDAFLLAGIYFTSPLILRENDHEKILKEQIERKANSLYLCQMLGESSAVL